MEEKDQQNRIIEHLVQNGCDKSQRETLGLKAEQGITAALHKNAHCEISTSTP